MGGKGNALDQMMQQVSIMQQASPATFDSGFIFRGSAKSAPDWCNNNDLLPVTT